MIKRIDVKSLTLFGSSGSWAETFGLFPTYNWIKKYASTIMELYPCYGEPGHTDDESMCFYECSRHRFWNRPREQVVATINDALERYC